MGVSDVYKVLTELCLFIYAYSIISTLLLILGKASPFNIGVFSKTALTASNTNTGFKLMFQQLPCS